MRFSQRKIAYMPALNPFTGGPEATLACIQLDWRFSTHPSGYYKFLEPCKHPLYKNGDSWTEELGFTKHGFKTAFNKIGVRYKSRSEFAKIQHESYQSLPSSGQAMIDNIIKSLCNVTYFSGDLISAWKELPADISLQFIARLQDIIKSTQDMESLQNAHLMLMRIFDDNFYLSFLDRRSGITYYCRYNEKVNTMLADVLNESPGCNPDGSMGGGENEGRRFRESKNPTSRSKGSGFLESKNPTSPSYKETKKTDREDKQREAAAIKAGENVDESHNALEAKTAAANCFLGKEEALISENNLPEEINNFVTMPASLATLSDDEQTTSLAAAQSFHRRTPSPTLATIASTSGMSACANTVETQEKLADSGFPPCIPHGLVSEATALGEKLTPTQRGKLIAQAESRQLFDKVKPAFGALTFADFIENIEHVVLDKKKFTHSNDSFEHKLNTVCKQFSTGNIDLPLLKAREDGARKASSSILAEIRARQMEISGAMASLQKFNHIPDGVKSFEKEIEKNKLAIESLKGKLREMEVSA